MDERQTFTGLLQDMLEQAQINGNQISQQEIQELFEDLNLSEEQMNHIYSYLVAHRITVKGFVPSAAMKRESRLYEVTEQPEGEESAEKDDEPEEKSKKATGSRRKADSDDEGVKKARRKVAAADRKAGISEDDEVEPDSAFLRMYLRELRGVEKLTKAQELALAEELVAAALSGANVQLEELKTRYINHKLRFVVTRARKYALGGETLDELVQEGNIGLMLAMQQMNGVDGLTSEISDGATFIARVEEQIVHAMEQYINETYASGSEEQAMVAKVNFVSEAAKALKEENGQEPTLAEMAAYTNLTEEELLAIISLSADNLKA